eukprot:15101742-Alexandrium_andersonii.AAC.1
MPDSTPLDNGMDLDSGDSEHQCGLMQEDLGIEALQPTVTAPPAAGEGDQHVSLSVTGASPVRRSPGAIPDSLSDPAGLRPTQLSVLVPMCDVLRSM